MSVTRREFLMGCLAIGGTCCCKKNGNDARVASPKQPAPGGAAAPGVPTDLPVGFQPAYLPWVNTPEWKKREKLLFDMMSPCRLCPRRCGAKRLEGERGICRVADELVVASHGPHMGEEPPITGRRGSGTIFFSWCNLLCEYCQNYDIAHHGSGNTISAGRLAAIMIQLQGRGCHNINLVTPTHIAPHAFSAIGLAAKEGLKIPIVYNTGGYDSPELIDAFDKVVDIYLPDFKYQDSKVAARLSRGAANYPEIARECITRMHRQVGHLVTDENGIAQRGLLIRHLVMPENLAGTDRFVQWVAKNLGKQTMVNIMGQYHPAFRAENFPEIARPVNRAEFAQALKWGEEAGLRLAR